MTAVLPRGGRRFLMFLLPLFLLLTSAPGARPRVAADVPPPPGPVIVSLEAVPSPRLGSITARAVIRTAGLSEAATVALSIGASTAWARIDPGVGDVTIERDVPLTRAKPWTPGRPVRFLLIAGVTRRSAPLDRRGIRFALRTLDLTAGGLRLNGVPFQIRGVAQAPGAASTVPALKSLRAAGYNAMLLAPGDRTPAAHDACDAAGLLALDEVPAPGPALIRLRPGAVPPPDKASLEVFGTASAFVDAVRAALADRIEGALAAIRLDPGAPGFLVEAAAAPDLAGRFAERSLAVTPPPALADPAMPLSATITVGAGPWPADAVLEWRADIGGDGAWRALARGPARLSPGTARILTLPPSGLPGRRSIAVRVRAGSRTLATGEARWRVAELKPGSRRSFALVGDAPGLRGLYESWLIPVEQAPVIVVVHPAALSVAEQASLFEFLSRGRTVVFLELNAADSAALAGHPEGCWTISTGAVDPVGASHLTWIRPGRFGAELPGTGITEPGRWFAGPPYVPMLPELSLHPVPGATIWAGESPVAPDVPALASVMSVAAGAGHAVFCQWRLLEALPDPLGRLVFEKLLGL